MRSHRWCALLVPFVLGCSQRTRIEPSAETPTTSAGTDGEDHGAYRGESSRSRAPWARQALAPPYHRATAPACPTPENGVYDECKADSDCEGCAVCECGLGTGGANVCVASGCRVDAECGPNEYCTFGGKPCDEWDLDCDARHSFECTGPRDTCTPLAFGVDEHGRVLDTRGATLCTGDLDVHWCTYASGHFQCVE